MSTCGSSKGGESVDGGSGNSGVEGSGDSCVRSGGRGSGGCVGNSSGDGYSGGQSLTMHWFLNSSCQLVGRIGLTNYQPFIVDSFPQG